MEAQKAVLQHKYNLRPRYNEVDRMGYVYHGNYVGYCHQARTEMLRTLGINDKFLEDHGIMLPVIEMNLKYHQPAGYDDELEIVTSFYELPKTRFKFEFEIYCKNRKICTAQSTVVFVDSLSRKPMRAPDLVRKALVI